MYKKCVLCGKVSLEGSLCDCCAVFDIVQEEDAQTLAEMRDQSLVHVIGEYDARAVLGLQLMS